MAAMDEDVGDLHCSSLLQQILHRKKCRQRRSLMERLDQTRAQRDAVSDEHRELKKEPEGLESALQNESLLANAIRKETEKLTQLNQSLRELIQELQEKRQLPKILEDRKKAVVQENVALQLEIKKMSRRVRDAKTCRTMTAKLVTAIEAMERQTEALRNDLQLLTSRYEEEPPWQDMNEEKEKSLDELKKTTDNLQQQIKLLEDQHWIKDIRKTTYAELVFQYNIIRKKEKSFRKIYSKLLKQLLKEEDWSGKCGWLQKGIDDLNQKKKDFTKEMNSCHQNLRRRDKYKEEYKSLVTENTSLVQEMTFLEKELKALQKKQAGQQALEKENKAMEVKNRSLRQSILKLRRILNELE